MTIAYVTTHTKTLLSPSSGTADKVYGSDYVSSSSHATSITMATARLLGRTTAGTGLVEEISVGSGLTLSAGSLSASASGTTLDSITAAVGSATIASGNNTGIVWNWANTTDSTVAFTFGETSAATNGTSTSGVPNQVLLKLTTLAASTQSPLSVFSRATHVFSVSPTAAQILAGANGVVYSFAASATTGMGMSGSNLQFTVNNFQTLILTSTQVLARSGSATVPSFSDGSNATTGLFFGANFMGVGDSTSGELMRFVGGTANVRYTTRAATTFANLPAAANGSELYCSDCDPASLIDSTCTSTGTKTGSMAARVNGAWKCYT